MELPRPFCHIYLATIHRARLLAMHDAARADEERNTHAFDFGRRGSAALPLSDGNVDGIERRTLLKHGRNCTFEPADRTNPRTPQPIGDSVVGIESPVVSLLPYSTVQGVVG